MTIDEAIKHAEEVAEEKEKLCKFNDDFNFSQPEWRKCAEEHRQLAEWLKELKQLREQTRWILISEKMPDEDWVLVQIQQNNGYLWEVPCIAGYREYKGDWIIEHNDMYWLNEELNKELRDTDILNVVAWTHLPKQYKV